MPVTAQWLDEDHDVVYQVFDGEWTWDEFYACHQTIIALMGSVSHPVHLLIHVANISFHLPKGLFTHFRRTLEEFPENHEHIVAISDNRFVSIIASTSSRILPPLKNKGVLVVHTKDHALRVLGKDESGVC